MVKKILALLAGFVVANVIIIVLQLVAVMIYGMPENPNDETAMANYISGMPVTAFLLLFFGYALGYFAGGFVMQKIAKWDSMLLPLILGAMGTVGWIVNFVRLPHPTWAIVVGFFCFIPFAFIGYRLAKS